MLEKYSRILHRRYRKYKSNREIQQSHFDYHDTWFQGFFGRKSRFMAIYNSTIYYKSGKTRFDVEKTLQRQKKKELKKEIKEHFRTIEDCYLCL